MFIEPAKLNEKMQGLIDGSIAAFRPRGDGETRDKAKHALRRDLNEEAKR